MIEYDPQSDQLWVQLRPWPNGVDGQPMPHNAVSGGEDADDGLIIHFAPDGLPFAWEIEHASEHPELVVQALRTLRDLREPIAA